MLRSSLPILLALALLLAASAKVTLAEPVASPLHTATSLQTHKPVIDDSDDSRVAVQLVVAGIAAGVVVVLGCAAYVLRKKLGLVAPPPDQGGHH